MISVHVQAVRTVVAAEEVILQVSAAWDAIVRSKSATLLIGQVSSKLATAEVSSSVVLMVCRGRPVTVAGSCEGEATAVVDVGATAAAGVACCVFTCTGMDSAEERGKQYSIGNCEHVHTHMRTSLMPSAG
jgi:hypothetical protein